LLWTFTRQIGDVRQAIAFQRHKYDDAFTVEVAWSCIDNPFAAPWGGPNDEFWRTQSSGSSSTPSPISPESPK
jgi:hypothetical protein